MSQNLAVVLECGPIPDHLIPEEHRCAGQNAVRYLGPLAALARDLGWAPLDDFIVDHCDLVEAALREAGWQEPDPPPEWGGVIPIGGPRVTDPAYQAALARYDQIVEQVEASKPWYVPADGLRTVSGLIGALNSRPELAERLYGAVWDLQAYAFALSYADQVGTRFQLGVSY
jgi:hypothetical protein